MSNSYSDPEIIKIVKTGGEEMKAVLRYLWQGMGSQQLHRGVIGYIRKREGTEKEAKTIFVDAILQFLDNVRAGKVKTDSKVAAYIMGISKNLWREQNRKQQKAPTAIESMEPWKQERVFSRRDQEYFEGDCKQVLETVGNDCSRLIRLKDLNGFGLQKVRDQLKLDISVQAIHQRIQKCRKKLKTILRNKPELMKYLSDKGADYFPPQKSA